MTEQPDLPDLIPVAHLVRLHDLIHSGHALHWPSLPQVDPASRWYVTLCEAVEAEYDMVRPDGPGWYRLIAEKHGGWFEQGAWHFPSPHVKQQFIEAAEDAVKRRKEAGYV